MRDGSDGPDEVPPPPRYVPPPPAYRPTGPPAPQGPPPPPPAPPSRYSYGSYQPAIDSGANTALGLGLASVFCCGLLGPIALFAGVSARRRIRRSNGFLGGAGRAAWGIGLGALTTIVFGLTVILFLVGLLSTAFGYPLTRPSPSP
jgi:hypothetical protein